PRGRALRNGRLNANRQPGSRQAALPALQAVRGHGLRGQTPESSRPGAKRLRLRRRLAQQRPGGLLEDLAPGAGLLLLGAEVLDDLAHARRGDLDAVALADRPEVVVVGGELQRHRLEAVAGDLDAARE